MGFIYRGIDGWPLSLIAQHENSSPGVLLHLICSPDVERQVAFAVLSAREVHAANAILLLRARKLRDAIAQVYGSAPQGYLGTLRRLGGDPLPAPCYRMLHREFAARSRRARALMQTSGTLTRARVHAALHLDELVVHPVSLDCRQIEDINAAIKLIRSVCRGVDDRAVRQSFLASRQSPGDWLLRWLGNLSALPVPHPIPAEHPELRPLLSGSEFVWAAREYRNCLGTRLAYAAVGKAHYGVTRVGSVAIEMRRLASGRWLVTQMAGRGNQEPSIDEMIRVGGLLRDLGIEIAAPRQEAGERALRLVRSFDLVDLGLPELPIVHEKGT